jgi:hypothetical protein
LPCGTLSTRRSPFGAQPRSLVMLVFVPFTGLFRVSPAALEQAIEFVDK